MKKQMGDEASRASAELGVELDRKVIAARRIIYKATRHWREL